MIASRGFYEIQLFVLAAFCAGAFLVERYISSQRTRLSLSTTNATGHSRQNSAWKAKSAGYARLLKDYLTVYAIVMGADWLQGPYVYSLYHEQYQYTEQTVAILFVTGFTSAGFFSPIVGDWADQNGRKRTCIIFCMSYAASCLLMLFNFLPILLIGRILGGFSTSILFSCFESWLISASSSSSTYGAISQNEVSSIMGSATMMNGFVAAAAGVGSNYLVKRTNNYLSPFMASLVLLVIALFVIERIWEENKASSSTSDKSTDGEQVSRLKRAWGIVRKDSALLTLLFTQTAFEGSMYLFVFLWVPSLKEVSPLVADDLPLGNIFSSFMISMMLGSFFYTCVINYPPPSPPSTTTQTETKADESLPLHVKLASLVCAFAAFLFALASSSGDPAHRFWAFCLFEATVGIYYPVMGVLRSKLVPDEVRATLYSLFRLPLNAFVIVMLMTGTTGGGGSKRTVWVGCSTGLVIACLSLARLLGQIKQKSILGTSKNERES